MKYPATVWLQGIFFRFLPNQAIHGLFMKIYDERVFYIILIF